MSQDAVPEREAVLAALDEVRDPRTGKGLAAAGLVRGLSLRAGRAGFMLEVPASEIERYRTVRDAAESALASVPGVASAQVVLTADGPAADLKVAPRRRAQVADDPQARLGNMPEAERPEHVHKVIAIASGKGGVGKSTVAVNLAVAFATLGKRAGLLDADIYGPSAPTMLGVDEEPTFGPDTRLNPVTAPTSGAARWRPPLCGP
jgi:ATP-binding protein involved in chromosome partitioning